MRITVVTGTLTLQRDGYGLLQREAAPSADDVYVQESLVRRLQLQSGDEVTGRARPAASNERWASLLDVQFVNGRAAER